MHKTSQKYFDFFAEAENHSAAKLLHKKIDIPYDYALCIPAYDEIFDLINTHFFNLATQKKLLIILIVNTPLTSEKDHKLAEQHIGNLSSAEIRTNTLIANIHSHYPSKGILNNLSLHKINQYKDILLIQRTGDQGIPYKQGVGLARKIANDCAVRLMEENIISQKVLFNTDSDAQLPDNYFSNLMSNIKSLDTETVSAWIFPFKHSRSKDSLTDQACQIYQSSLINYKSGLVNANSPFAFHTIGSTLAINAKHYIEVRGFPKKNAGEDFYLLNKLRKIGNIVNLSGGKGKEILLNPRQSHRVPFGTGPAVKSLGSSKQPHKETIFYDPRCFDYLKGFLQFWNSVFIHKDTLISVKSIKDLLLEELNILDTSIKQNILETILIDAEERLSLLMHLQLAKNEHHWQKLFIQKFDAFQTLKLLHSMRDKHFPSINFEQASQTLLQKEEKH